MAHLAGQPRLVRRLPTPLISAKTLADLRIALQQECVARF